jgi:hypothetical protein
VSNLDLRPTRSKFPRQQKSFDDLFEAQVERELRPIQKFFKLYKEKEMVDFRKMIPVLAVIAFMLGSAVTASAQNTPFQCFANGGVSTPARAEGLTEIVGDLVLNCQGGTPAGFGLPINPVNIQVFLNTALTSRLLTSSTTNPYSEALLLLDEPQPQNQFACSTSSTICPAYGSSTGAGFGSFSGTPPTFVPSGYTTIGGVYTNGYYGNGVTGSSLDGCTVGAFGPAGTVVGCPGNNKNVFQGIQTTSNSVTFLAVPIDPPGTSGGRTIRITNIRGNANALGVAGSNATPTPIVETVSPNPPQFLPVSNPSQTVAFIQRGLVASLLAVSTVSSGVFGASTTVGTATSLQQCNSNRATSSSTLGNAPVVFLNYKEQFATAFKQRFVGDSVTNPSAGPSTVGLQQNNLTTGGYNTESDFVNTALVLPSGGQTTTTTAPNVNVAGLADWGTRLIAVFNNIPNGVSIFVDNRNNNTGITTPTPDVAVLTPTETGAFSAPGTSVSTNPVGVGGVGTTQLTVVNGSASAIWEEIVSDPNTFASLNFGVYIFYTASPGTNSPALGTTTVNLSYSPRSTVTTASQINVPRFADTSTATNIFTVVPCLTTLLFPFVTNSSGFDTGIAISSTSTDPFGTTPQSGTCTLNWYGTAFTGATPTPTINSGTSYTLLVSTTLNTVTGGFTGYMIAVCRFQYAHGFAFISDLGARNLAMGYLALVIPDPTSSGVGRLATPGECGGANNVGGPLAGCLSTGEALTE